MLMWNSDSASGDTEIRGVVDQRFVSCRTAAAEMEIRRKVTAERRRGMWWSLRRFMEEGERRDKVWEGA